MSSQAQPCCCIGGITDTCSTSPGVSHRHAGLYEACLLQHNPSMHSSLRPGCLNRKHRGAGHGHALLLCGAFLGEQLRFQRRCALFTKAGTKTCAALLATASQGNGQHLASQKMQWQDGHALTEQQDTSVCGVYAGREAFFQHHTKVFPPANRVAELDAPAQASTAKDLSVMDSV